jgi:TAG lipase/steryl ester hydrolase/phospholipase A2/LPA acyltransferase
LVSKLFMLAINNETLINDIKDAETYPDYKAACLLLDEQLGHETWKNKDESTLYDYKLIKKRLDSMRQARIKNDIAALTSIIGEGLHGNLGNIGNKELYQTATIGTKTLIEKFISEVCQSLKAIYECDENSLTTYQKKVFFDKTSQAYGKSALILSGAAGLGFFHGGLLKTLIDNDLLPDIISGSSAGALFAAVIGTRPLAEALELLSPENIYHDFKEVFKLSSNITKSVFNPVALENAIIRLFDTMTFEEAYLKTGIDINVSVSPLDHNQQPRLLNAISSPNVIISSAIRASAAFPYGFPAVQLYAKNADGEIHPYIENKKFLDGSINLDIPITQLARIHGVNHTIVSQTNPLVTPFLSRSNQIKNPTISFIRNYVEQSILQAGLFGCHIAHRLAPGETAKLVVKKVQGIMSQSYLGDINILPSRRFDNFTAIFSNPTVDSIHEQMKEAEKVAWPVISRIENTTKINKTIKHFQKKLNEQLAS